MQRMSALPVKIRRRINALVASGTPYAIARNATLRHFGLSQRHDNPDNPDKDAVRQKVSDVDVTLRVNKRAAKVSSAIMAKTHVEPNVEATRMANRHIDWNDREPSDKA